MKVHLIKKQTIEDYVMKNARSRVSFQTWMSIIQRADWECPNDMLSTFKSNLLGKNTDRVVFNIGGNKFRLICKYYFGETKIHLFVKWIGNHSEYTKLCDEGKQYKVSSF